MVQEAECALSHKEEIFNKFIYLKEIVKEWLHITEHWNLYTIIGEVIGLESIWRSEADRNILIFNIIIVDCTAATLYLLKSLVASFDVRREFTPRIIIDHGQDNYSWAWKCHASVTD